jgi:hypothetical protein
VKPVRYDDLRTFCRVDGWTRKADAPGAVVRKHEVWTRQLPDGDVLRVAISKGRGDYPPPLASRILKHELRVTEREFWAAARDGVAPERPGARARPPDGPPLPYSLVRALLAAGVTPDDLRGLTPEEAKALLA